MKKIMALLLAVMLIFVGCSSGNTNQSNETQKVTTTQKQDQSSATNKLWSDPGVFPIVEKPMEIKMFAAVYESSGPLAENKMLKEYEEKSNIIVKWEEVTHSDHETKLTLSLASGVYPDAYFNCSINTAQQLIYGQQGILMPLNDLIEAESVNIKAAYTQYPEIKAASVAPDGNIYSLFQYDPAVHMKALHKMYLNTEWVKASGLGMPKTLDEFKTILKYFRDNDMNGDGNKTDEIPMVASSVVNPSGTFHFSSIVPFIMNAFILTTTSGVSVKDGVVLPVYTQPEWREGLRFLRSLYDEKLIGSESFTQDQNSLKALVNRPEKMIVGGVPGMWQGDFLTYAEFSDKAGYETYSAVQPLIGPAGVAQTSLCSDGVLVSRGIQITKACKNPEILIKWIDYWYEESNAFMQLRGKEGVHYSYVDEPGIDGSKPSYKRNQDTIQPPVYDFISNQGPMFFTNKLRYNETAVPGSAGVQLYKDGKMYMEYIDPKQQYLPFTIWLDEESTRAKALLEQSIITYVTESAARFIIGDMDIDKDWEQYIAQLKAIDLDKYIQIQQSVFDATK